MEIFKYNNMIATYNGKPAYSTNMNCIDADGNSYNYIQIGTQIWMSEYLKTTKYNNGDLIGTTSTDISGETSPKYQWPVNNDEANVIPYGRLYTWFAATDSRNICPPGWHLPSVAEFQTLQSYLGGESVCGGKLKEAGTTHWDAPNTGATNESGFTALACGDRRCLGGFVYWDFSQFNALWSSGHDIAPSLNAKYFRLSYDSASGIIYFVGAGGLPDYYGKSVRCIRD